MIIHFQADKVIINKKIIKIGKKYLTGNLLGVLGMFKVSKKMWKSLFNHYEMLKKKYKKITNT